MKNWMTRMKRVAWTLCVLAYWIGIGGSIVFGASPAPLQGLANVRGIAVSYHGDMAPETVHVDVIGIDGKSFADRALSYEWTFGDTGRYAKWNDIPAGWNCAHLYDAAGTYAIKCTVSNGAASRVFTMSVTVAPDTRKHIKASTYSQVAKAAGDNVYIEVQPGAKIDPAGQASVSMNFRNLVLDGFGTAELHCNSNAQEIVQQWPGKTVNTLIRGFKVVSDEEDKSAEGGQGHFFGKGWLGWIRGQGQTLSELTMDHLGEGIQLDTNVSFALVQQCATVNRWSVSRSVFWMEGQNIVELGNVGHGSAWENVRRSADFGWHRGLCYGGSYGFPTNVAPFQNKCPNTMRTVSDGVIAYNAFSGGWTEFCPRSNTVEVRNVSYHHNTLSDCMLSLQAAVHDVDIHHCTFSEPTNNTGITIVFARPGATVDGISVHDCAFNTSIPRPLLTHGYAPGFDPPVPERPPGVAAAAPFTITSPNYTKFVPVTAYREASTAFKVTPGSH